MTVPTAEREDAKNELLHLMLVDHVSANKALRQLGLNWSHLHLWRTSAPEWAAEYAAARDTLADYNAERAAEILQEAQANLASLPDPKLAMAFAKLASDESRVHQWAAERTGRRRWSPHTPDEGRQVVQVVVHLPQVEPPPEIAQVSRVMERLRGSVASLPTSASADGVTAEDEPERPPLNGEGQPPLSGDGAGVGVGVGPVGGTG